MKPDAISTKTTTNALNHLHLPLIVSPSLVLQSAVGHIALKLVRDVYLDANGASIGPGESGHPPRAANAPVPPPPSPRSPIHDN